jgi:acid phosphatase type 7
MHKQFFLRAARLFSVLILGWMLSGANLQTAQARSAGVSPQAAAGATIYLPLVVNTDSTAPGSTDSVILAAGDIAKCTSLGDTQTAAIIQKISGTVLPLGDNAYDSGLPSEYATCYDPTWGAFKTRSKPVPGNHDYITAGAAGYFGYFGAAAGDPTQGYYSYNLGSWHILAINSNCVQVGGCNTNSPQETWVRADLAASKAKCVLAYWHHAFYTSGTEGSGRALQMAAIWNDLYTAGADVVLSGHQHNYERFAPQDAAQNLDTARGVVQFVVGTGGGNFTPLTSPLQPNSLTSLQNTYGVLQLTLHASSYSWKFIPVSGSYTDSGTANCH